MSDVRGAMDDDTAADAKIGDADTSPEPEAANEGAAMSASDG